MQMTPMRRLPKNAFAIALIGLALTGCASLRGGSGLSLSYKAPQRSASAHGGRPIFGSKELINCVESTSTPCNTTSNPGNGSQGMPAWQAFGAVNNDVNELYGMFGVTGILYGNGAAPNALTAATGAQILSALGLSGVTAGSYNVANITVDQYGRITAASSGIFGTITTGKLTYWVDSTHVGSLGTPTTCLSTQAATGIDASGNATGCWTPGGTGTVTDGSGTTTANEFLLSTTTAHTYSVATAAQAQAALLAATAATYSPTLASGATNDWDPSGGSGIATVGFANTTPNAAGSTVDGILAGSDKQEILLCNSAALGSSNSWILLENQSASDTTAANRLLGAGNAVLAPQACVMLRYVTGSVNRWVMGRVADAGTGATYSWATATSITPDQSFWVNKITASAPGTFTINAPTDGSPLPEQKMLLEVTAAANLSAPTQGSAPTTATTGGTCAAATYYYVVTATDSMGETTKSAEQSVVTTGTTSENTVSWTTVTNATGYKVYRGTSAGGENVYYSVSGGSTASLLDTCGASTSGSPPASNTSGGNTYSFNAAYVPSSTVALPTSQATAGKEDDFILYWSATKSAWKFEAANQGF